MQGFFKAFKSHFFFAALFSFFDNMLMLAMPIYMMQLFDRVMTSRSNETLVMLSLAAVGALLVMWVLEMLRARLLGAASLLMDQSLGGKVVSGLIKSAARLGARDYAQGLRDVAVLRGFLTGNSIFALFDTPWAIFFIVIIFIFHPLMGFIALGGAVLLLLVAVLNEKVTHKPLHDAGLASRKSSRFIDISIRNSEVVSAMGMVSGVRGRWQKMNDAVLEHQRVLTQRTSMINSFTKFLRQFIQIAMLGAGAYLVIDQHMTPGIMMAATLILGRALAPVEQAITTWKGIVDARESYDNLNQLLSDYKEDAGAMALPAPSGKLNVERLAFVTPTTRLAVIKGISFELNAGEVLGVIGPSAAGKSSLLRLVAGVWKPTAGAVRLDGADVSEWTREQIGEHIGYLPHDVELFAGSVGDNIARMLPAKDFSDQVIEAAKMAGVHDLILRLPNGYETEIGETGYVLSGGQRQRIALARALFNKPRLILLDEPNANLDGEGEAAFLNAVNAMKQNKMTVLIVTHKPAMLLHADKVLVMKEGLVEAFGPKDEVIGKTVRTASAVSNIQAVGV
ncbi:MAG: type I secretion system permease/ATPase [Methylotenera sp.]|nr:type I secretion system permease/ATPase [Methylotenera sp.]